MIYYRDPLLDKICDRINGLPQPAYIKNSELIYVAANQAFADLFNASITDFVGTDGRDHDYVDVLLNLADKERSCIVFGDDQTSHYADPFGKGRFHVEMERFTLADGQTFLYCIFGELALPDYLADDAGTAAEREPALEMPHSEAETRGGRLAPQEAEQLIDAFNVGVCIWNRDNRLTYFNARLADFYGPLAGPIELGMDMRLVAESAYDYVNERHPEVFANYPGGRTAWVDARMANYDQPESTEVLRLPTGRWIHSVNRRLADGTLIGLRIDITDVKQRELMLEQHVEDVSLFRKLLDQLPVATFARDADHRLVYVNPAYSEFFGRSHEDLIGTDERDLFGDHAPSVIEANQRTLEGGEDFEEEQETPLADGRMATTIAKTGLLVTDAGSRFIVGTLTDVSFMKQRERLLEDATAKAEAVRRDFENIVSSIDVGLIVLDADLRILLVNSAYRNRIWNEGAKTWTGELVGQPFEALLRNNYYAGRRPDAFDNFDSYCRQRCDEIRSGNIATREVTFSDGTVTLYSGIKLSGGNFLLCYVDLTELRRRDRDVMKAHEDVDRAYNLVTSATDAMPEGLMVIDGDQIVLSNKCLADVIRIDPRLLIPGGEWAEVFRATSRQNRELTETAIEASLERFRIAVASRKDISYNFRLDERRWIRIDLRAKDNGQMVILCTDHSDVMRREAELKRLIAKAEAADRAKSEFLANMSLEIRTPMNGILGMAELLTQSPLDSRQKAFIDVIVKSGNALLTIINDILDFSKLDSGQLQLREAPFDPAEALEDIAILYAAMAREKGLELVIRCAEDVPGMIIGDAGRFRQILSHLISNAVKFTDRGHVVASISSRADGADKVWLEVTVEDTGIGIPESRVGQIFEKFARMEDATGHREGTGLGLAISQKLAILLGGFITVESEEKCGSIFTLTLPASVAVGRSKPRVLPGNVENAHIMVVDDNEFARGHVQDMATEWGFDCAAADNGETALSILSFAEEEGLEVDALIIDSEMPGMNGVELVRMLRADPRFSEMPIILLISQDLGAIDAAYADLDIQAQILKPVRAQLLRDALIDVIRSHRNGKLRLAQRRPTAVKPMIRLVETPADYAEDDRLEDSSTPSPPPANRPIQVLVAEDNEVNRIVYTQILEAAGIDYRLAMNGVEALALWRQFQPDVIIMDMVMPGMNGVEATVAIRTAEAEEGGRVPIIGVLAAAVDSDRADCLAAGMDDVIVKPISPERLEEKIRIWLKNPMFLAGHG